MRKKRIKFHKSKFFFMTLLFGLFIINITSIPSAEIASSSSFGYQNIKVSSYEGGSKYMSGVARDDDGNLYVAYQTKDDSIYPCTDQYWWIKIKKSTDGGKTWSQLDKICYYGRDLTNPVMAISEDAYTARLHIAFEMDMGGHSDVWYNGIDDEGGGYSSYKVCDHTDFFGNPLDDRNPSIGVSYGTSNYVLYIACETAYSVSDNDIFVYRKSYGGSWTEDFRLGNGEATAWFNPSIDVGYNGQTVALSASRTTSSFNELNIYIKKNNVWALKNSVWDYISGARFPVSEVAVDKGSSNKVIVGYTEIEGSRKDVELTYTTDGEDWGDYTVKSYAVDPDLDVSYFYDNAFITYSDSNDIYLKYAEGSPDSWSSQIKVSDSADALDPSIVKTPELDNLQPEIAWTDGRDGNYNIYAAYWTDPQCTSGACCDLPSGNFKTSGSQPTGYSDDTNGFCPGIESPTGTSYVKTRDYYCNGDDSDMHHTDTTADTCGTCEYCSDNNLTCNYYSEGTSCGTDKECDGSGNCADSCDDSSYYSCATALSLNNNQYSSFMCGNQQFFKITTTQSCILRWYFIEENSDYSAYVKNDGSCPSISSYDEICSSPSAVCHYERHPPGTYYVMLKKVSGSGRYKVAPGLYDCSACECSSGVCCDGCNYYSEGTSCGSGKECDGSGNCLNIPCGGIDTSCGISPGCVNCNLQDSCNGNYYRNYYCASNSAGCSYTSDNCNDCSCSCGGYNAAETTANSNCNDGKDNDCDGLTDSLDSGCITCTNECSSGQTRCNGNIKQTCGNYDADACLEWGNDFDCGSDFCDAWQANYCKSSNVYHNRTCHNKGCYLSSCFDNVNAEEQLVQTCSYGCFNGVCNSLQGDTNSDCKVDIFDLAKVGVCYNRAATGSCSAADINQDGSINIFDLASVGLNYGKIC